MRNKVRMTLLGIVVALAAACSTAESRRDAAASPPQQQTAARQQHAPRQGAGVPPAAAHGTPAAPVAGPRRNAHGDSHDGHDHSSDRVPAFQIDAASLKSLPPTLSPDLFYGKQKLAYQVVKEIPKTIAQLPCYCYCDQGFGHKSLHSCFVDNHAAHCAVCVDEALLAYKLQKEEKLSPEQIRARVIAQYSPK